MDILGKMAIVFGLVLALMFVMASCNKTTVEDTSVGFDEKEVPETLQEIPEDPSTAPVEPAVQPTAPEPTIPVETPPVNETEPIAEPIDTVQLCPIQPPEDAVLIEGQFDDYFMKRYHINGEFSKSVGAYRTWYNDAHTRERTITCYDEDGKKTGMFKEWDANDFLVTEANYMQNKPDGAWIEWFNGYIKEEKTFVNGTLHGEYKLYYNSGDALGTIKEEGQYFQGKKDGEWKNYHFTTGNVREVLNYDKGRELGTYTKYFEDGSLNIKKMGEFINGQFNGYITTWSSSGSGENCTYVDGDVIHNGCVAI